ncbi:hypothetical protein CC1G_08283 [Coprinopsis cinerea okayama7|uniref:ABC transporter domain-containing protein n=1 Tax=Coprinopsis cinerea (strain Okayama-7 / 130 / ATCC MYA-4618 / FGSC 9003) TaxID=240176 RepID=A8PG37_COPC7|nr:hypothetical protein CC1G_08283 [Coprinopsis cinerea okayama7\|eukprot:XP_001841139.2 hypothetical protein CC1G_08283 [Coprinopsis cinerea okayama7\
MSVDRTHSSGSSTLQRSISQSSSSSSGSLQRLKWGIFDVVYERPPFLAGIRTWFRTYNRNDISDAFLSGFRLVLLLLQLNFSVACRYFFCAVWMSIAPGISLLLAHSVLNMIASEISYDNLKIDDTAQQKLSLMITLWLSSAFLTSYCSQDSEECKELLGGHLRAYFLPRLVDARLKHISMPTGGGEPESMQSFPNPWSFGDEVPGWPIVERLSSRISDALTLLSELFAFGVIITKSPKNDADVFGFLGFLAVFVMVFTPSNGAGGAGYTFWTNNPHYQRLLSLYSIIFDDQYKEQIVKDGLMDYLSSEYKSTSTALGAVKCNTLALACYLPPAWYWRAIQTLVLEYPMVLYALLIRQSFTTQSVVTIATLQYAIHLLAKSAIGSKARESESVMDVLKSAQELLDWVSERKEASPDSDWNGIREYHAPIVSRGAPTQSGMGIKMRSISFHYPGMDVPTIKSTSFHVNPGEFVLVVGGSGSGKSTLLKLVAGILRPQRGTVKVDGRHDWPMEPFPPRERVAFLSQNEPIYPLSLLENLVIGLGGRDKMNLVERSVAAAMKATGCDHLLKRMSMETILSPCQVAGRSIQGCGNGHIGRKAIDEWRKHDASSFSQDITPEDRQRLIAARYLVRMQHLPTVDLVVLDEPGSCMDPLSERELIRHFIDQRKGHTVIVVTRAFAHFARQADRIL